MEVSKKLATVLVGGALFGALSTPVAFAGVKDPDPKSGKCNSGRGNLSETDPSNDCDPGNSAGHNNGGD